MRILVHDCSGHAFTAELSRELSRRGNDVRHVWCSSFLAPKGGNTRRAGDPPSLELCDVALDRPFERFSYGGYSYLRRLRQELDYGGRVARQAADLPAGVLLSSNAPLFTQLRLARWSRRHGVRFVWWLQDFYSVPMKAEAERRLGPAGAPVGRFFEAVERSLAAGSAGIVAISEDFLPKLAEWGVDPARVTTIRNWAPLERLPVTLKDNPWSRRNGLADRPVLLYAGTLGLKHNPALLWRLAGHLAERRPDARLVVVSEGTGMDWLQTRQAAEPCEQLVLLPFQPFGEFAEVLGSAEVLVAILEPAAGAYAVPSKVLSYLCAGRPVLAAMPPENLASRTIAESGSGFVVAPDRPDELLERASRLLEDAALRSELGAGARRYAEENFAIDRVAARFEEFLAAATPL